MRPLLDAGHIYIAVSPLYALKDSKGTVKQYVYTRDELNKLSTKGFTIQRYKGLGELMPEQLWETTLNPKNRYLVQVTTKDIEENTRMLDICMGKDVSVRRDYIFEHSSFN